MKLKNLIGFISLALISACNNTEKLPYLQMEVVAKEVNGKIISDTTFRTIPNFSLYNQDSTIVTQKDFDNSIYVADFFFTSCPTICPTMHRNLFKVYKKFENNEAVKFASHTIDVK